MTKKLDAVKKISSDEAIAGHHVVVMVCITMLIIDLSW